MGTQWDHGHRGSWQRSGAFKRQRVTYAVTTSLHRAPGTGETERPRPCSQEAQRHTTLGLGSQQSHGEPSSSLLLPGTPSARPVFVHSVPTISLATDTRHQGAGEPWEAIEWEKRHEERCSRLQEWAARMAGRGRGQRRHERFVWGRTPLKP